MLARNSTKNLPPLLFILFVLCCTKNSNKWTSLNRWPLKHGEVDVFRVFEWRSKHTQRLEAGSGEVGTGYGCSSLHHENTNLQILSITISYLVCVFYVKLLSFKTQYALHCCCYKDGFYKSIRFWEILYKNITNWYYTGNIMTCDKSSDGLKTLKR